MNIVLMGYRGTGKSTVGRLLAARLGRELVSTDAEIIERAQHSIPEIVAQKGWEHFRDLESDICREFASRDQLVIDTGGGAILRVQNVEALKKNGTVFWLTASVETIAKRIGSNNQRPSLRRGRSPSSMKFRTYYGNGLRNIKRRPIIVSLPIIDRSISWLRRYSR